MEKLFGVQTTSIALVLMIMLALCLMVTVWVAIRRPVVFKLGVRNIPRRKAQTILIVVGLMLSTLIMSAALGIGDTIDYSMSNDVYDTLVHVDEQVVASQLPEAGISTGHTKIDDSALTTVQNAVAGDP